MEETNDAEVQLWEPTNGRIHQSYSLNHRWARSIIVSPDGSRAVSPGVCDAMVWDLKLRKLL